MQLIIFSPISSKFSISIKKWNNRDIWVWPMVWSHGCNVRHSYDRKPRAPVTSLMHAIAKIFILFIRITLLSEIMFWWSVYWQYVSYNIHCRIEPKWHFKPLKVATCAHIYCNDEYIIQRSIGSGLITGRTPLLRRQRYLKYTTYTDNNNNKCLLTKKYFKSRNMTMYTIIRLCAMTSVGK